MLIKDYYYYLFKILQAGLLSWAGILCIAAIVIALYCLLRLRPSRPAAGVYGFWGAFAVAIVLAFVVLYSGTYEYPEDPGLLPAAIASPADNQCPAAWTGWRKAGYGFGNPCPTGCIRGITLRKQMSMTDFPPYPKYRREVQCIAADL